MAQASRAQAAIERPEGLLLSTEFITADEAAMLESFVEGLRIMSVAMRGQVARRNRPHFGND